MNRGLVCGINMKRSNIMEFLFLLGKLKVRVLNRVATVLSRRYYSVTGSGTVKRATQSERYSNVKVPS